jgi:hypothetical protein
MPAPTETEEHASTVADIREGPRVDGVGSVRGRWGQGCYKRRVTVPLGRGLSCSSQENPFFADPKTMLHRPPVALGFSSIAKAPSIESMSSTSSNGRSLANA